MLNKFYIKDCFSSNFRSGTILKFLKCINDSNESEKAKRHKLSEEEGKKRNQEYGQPERLLKEIWKQDHPWLIIERKDDGKEVTFCDYCIPVSTSACHETNVQRNAFIYECSNIRLETIKIHETTILLFVIMFPWIILNQTIRATQRILQHIRPNIVLIRLSMPNWVSCSKLNMPSIFKHNLPLILFGWTN